MFLFFILTLLVNLPDMGHIQTKFHKAQHLMTIYHFYLNISNYLKFLEPYTKANLIQFELCFVFLLQIYFIVIKIFFKKLRINYPKSPIFTT